MKALPAKLKTIHIKQFKNFQNLHNLKSETTDS